MAKTYAVATITYIKAESKDDAISIARRLRDDLNKTYMATEIKDIES